jgi:homoserine kinase type II
LRLIHSIQLQARGAGLDFIPVPHRTTAGDTFLQHDGTLWELADWMPGSADFRDLPTDARLESALESLARFHRAVEILDRRRGPPPGIRARYEGARQWMHSDLARVTAAVRGVDWPEFRVHADRLLMLATPRLIDIDNQLLSVIELAVDLQPVLRDIWHDHVLFQGDSVSGVVDFGAVRTDSVATDLARLLGSLVGNQPAKWSLGLAAYESIRPLSPSERQLIDIFDRSTIVLSGLNWIRWIALERRQFDEPDRVLARMDEILGRMREG